MNFWQTFRAWVEIFCIDAGIYHTGSRGKCFSVFLCAFPTAPTLYAKPNKNSLNSNLCTRCTTFSRFMWLLSHPKNLLGAWSFQQAAKESSKGFAGVKYFFHLLSAVFVIPLSSHNQVIEKKLLKLWKFTALSLYFAHETQCKAKQTNK